MKKLLKVFTTLALSVTLCLSATVFAGCGNKDKTITVCASQVPHAEVLNECVKDILAEKGYTLKVKVIDWTMQNDGVANKDYDANYFQHVPYLNTYSGKVELFASCKVHYEPLGIYRGKSSGNLADGKSFEICNDVSNAIRAFQLLEAKGIINKETEGTNFPINDTADAFTFADTSTTWTSKDGQITVSLIAEELLVASMPDYDFACLPCNTAYTGKVNVEKRVAVEDDAEQVAGKANIIAARKKDYEKDSVYKAKIDALTDAMLSEKVSEYFATKYYGAMTCDSTTQIDLRK